VVMRLNPFSAEWERQFEFAGEARNMARTSAGALLLRTSAGVYRRDAMSNWTMTWNAPADGLALMGERVAVAWHTGNTWQVAESADGGQGWGPADRVALGAPGVLGPAYPVLTADGLLEVVGVYTPPASGGYAPFALPIVVQRQNGAWYPPLGGHVEPIVGNLADARPAGRLVVTSVGGVNLVGWEGIGFNGATDIYATTR
jgi:hypothetical protein